MDSRVDDRAFAAALEAAANWRSRAEAAETLAHRLHRQHVRLMVFSLIYCAAMTIVAVAVCLRHGWR